jgi:predicted DNA repair protein MutK
MWWLLYYDIDDYPFIPILILIIILIGGAFLCNKCEENKTKQSIEIYQDSTIQSDTIHYDTIFKVVRSFYVKNDTILILKEK